MSVIKHNEKPEIDLPPDTQTAALGFGDLSGLIRGQRIHAQHWEAACKNGIATITAMFAVDMTCDIWETPFCNMGKGYPAMHLDPISAPVACPREPGAAKCCLYRGHESSAYPD